MRICSRGPPARAQTKLRLTQVATCSRIETAVEQLPADVAVGDRPDHAPAGILGKQDAEHVGIEAPKRFLDRFGLGNGNERAIQQFSGPKGADPASVEG